MAKYCTNCGAPLIEGALICGSCGSSVESSDSTYADTHSSTDGKYCAKCGQVVDVNAVICIHCGCALTDTNSKSQDSKSVGWGFLGFFLSVFFSPIIGLIMWLTWKDQYPQKAKRVGIGTLVAVILCVAIGIGIAVWYFTMFNQMFISAFEPIRYTASALS